MRIVSCSDAHLDARTAGVERFEEIRGSFDEAVRFAIEQRPQLTIFSFTGDLCDPEDGRDVLRASAYALGVALDLKEEGIPSIWVAGNHDPCGDGKTTTLEPLVELGRRFPDEVIVASTRPVSHLFGAGEFWLLVLPYVPTPYDAEREMLKAGEAAKREGVPLYVFSHLMLPDMHPGSESLELARGKDHGFPLEAMRKVKPQLVVNGHYHAAAIVHDVIHIPGSLARLTHGEEGNRPGFLVIDV
jgi:DNA repair exonuclease SbcCD nuclease subunit